jgi:hypothetical protein
MTVKSSKLPAEEPLRLWNLPADVGTVLIPEFLTVEMEDDETLLAYPANDAVVLRFSCISIVTKGSSSEDRVQKHLRDRAAREQLEYKLCGDNGVLTYAETSEQDGQPLVIRFWDVGTKNTLVVISATSTPDDNHETTVQRLLDLMPTIVESVKITKTQKIITDEDGEEVEITDQEVEPTEQELLPFGDADFAWLDESRQNATELGLKYGSGGELTPASLDDIFGRWMLDDDVEKEDEGALASALGAAFGDYLVEHHNVAWLVVSDTWGTERAIKHRSVDSIAFPRASVVKRIEDRKTEFFRGLLAAILHGLAELGVKD